MQRMLALIALLAAFPAHAEVILLRLEGMTCVTCEEKVTRALDALEFLSKAQANTPNQKACAELTGALSTPAINEAITGLGYTVVGQDILDACPDITTSTRTGIWANTEGMDAAIISTGAEVTFEAHLIPDKFTVFDFGADWCGPCHAAEKLLTTYLKDHSDMGVRAIVLDGKTAKESFKLPVAHQHLSVAPGLPYFVVYSPDGKRIYRGIDLPKALQTIDKNRK